jgi:hypothetical protein
VSILAIGSNEGLPISNIGKDQGGEFGWKYGRSE